MIEIFAWRGGVVERGVGIDRLPELLADTGAVTWVDLAEPTPDEAQRVLAETFGFHPLSIEDTLLRRQQPKLEEFGRYVYMICHGVRAGAGPEQFVPVELDLFLGQNFLVTSHDERSRSIDEAREAVLRTGGALRRGPAALLHAILDAQADHYEPVLDQFGQRIEQLEREAIEAGGRPRQETLGEILSLKRSLLRLRRGVERQTHIVLRLSRRELAHVGPEEALLLRDVHDHLVRAAELVDQHREMLGSVLEMQMAVASQRLNEVLKVLTIFSSIMLPLSLIAGIYGMNFEFMPELRWRWGYPFALGLMAATTMGLLVYFRRSGWLGEPARPAAKPPPPELAELARLPEDARRQVASKSGG
ncbi:MAG: magnesium/cobalt transporter CorA [Myxococcota bacterium]